jgi:hypothetical protein
MPDPQVLLDVSITVEVDVSEGSAVVVPPAVHGAAGTKFAWQLQLVNSPGEAYVKAFLELPDHDVLAPDQGTADRDFQGVVYPFQDNAGHLFRPTFHAVQGDVEVEVLITIVFPNSDHPSAAVTSVVIIDMD